MISYNQARKIILKHGLRPASQRQLPLFTLSCISLGYTKLLKKLFKLSSYKATGAIGGRGEFHTLFNELNVAKETEKFINKNYKSLGKLVFSPVQKILEKSIKNFSEIKKEDEPVDNLKIINDFYAQYMSSIGVLNCFWRYLGNEEKRGKLTAKDVEKISKIRERVAKFYPEVEKSIKDLTFRIGKAEKFDGDLLRYLTHSEMEKYTKNKLNIKKMLSILSCRRKKYFYLYIEENNQEKIITDKNFIKKLHNEFFLVGEKGTTLKGFAAFQGIARGKVFNLQKHKIKDLKRLSKNYILVTSMTHPSDIYFVKHSRAVITDEGGILSHAAIISRELKIPCIIGTKIATQVLKDGDLVEVDADKGRVKILR